MSATNAVKNTTFSEKSNTDDIAKEFGIPLLAKIPSRPEIRKLVDEGKIEQAEIEELNDFVDALTK